ncbi:methyl-accepting chemotaxis protein [Microvirga tunisiensis]|uniref:Methyl-accepting chemotaxis protein n=2 Tax=Pannonibacter tanglangensis TaxID=2750084 RepID=A0ABW9ZJL9_9HYPH|nr:MULTISPECIES: methyl-accepting chemotaxis protein [unclassified Pannonibacter]NBN63254.1 methyl-accepting chemotaxis protein [Pannonibacter sp. XCT-34]NBN76892.1 methyl-accepting chemotaxis protein [Pannonibacter sp. XCT-53]
MVQGIAIAEGSSQLSDIVRRTSDVRDLAMAKVGQIKNVTGRLRVLALNAMIESARAGDQGRGFHVVAQEVRDISSSVESISGALAEELAGEIAQLEALARNMASHAQGQRLVDLSLNAIEIMDRNLFERTCDVRWWATDAALVDCLAQPSPARSSFACERLGVILGAYTVYLDIWVCDLDGTVIASGRPDRYPVIGQSVRSCSWFQKGQLLRSGEDYVADDITRDPLLAGAQAATYVASVREGGAPTGRAIGMLAVHFDWEPQARAIVEGVRLSAAERDRSRVLLVDRRGRVLASSDRQGLLTDQFPLRSNGREHGCYIDDEGAVVAFHRTPGYETYRGLGWCGVIRQRL